MNALYFIGGAPLRCPNLEAYWSDPAPFEAERRDGQAKIDALFAAHTARVRAQQEARWAQEEQGEA
jgi:hypothetical protein